MLSRVLSPAKNLIPSWPSSNPRDDCYADRIVEVDITNAHEQELESCHEDPKMEGSGGAADTPAGRAPMSEPMLRSEGDENHGARSSEAPRANQLSNSPCDREYRKIKREEIRDLTKEVARLMQQLQFAKQDLSEASIKAGRDSQTIDALHVEKNDLLVQAQYTINDYRARRHLAEEKATKLETGNRALEEENRMLRERLRGAEAKQLWTENLLQERNAEFKGVQTFLTTADRYSGAEIIKMVESLNAEIFQIAASIAELLEEDSMIASQEEQAANVQKYQDTVDRARRYYIGKGLFTYLANKSAGIREDPLPVQLAIQAVLARWCVVETQPFWSGTPGEVLGKLYREIRASESQAVAGRWRAITSAQLRSFTRPNTESIRDIILSLLSLCGWSMSNERAKKLISTMEQMLDGVQKQQIQLRTAIKEEITTVDMEVYAIKPGMPFGEEMEDTYVVERVSAPIQESGKQVLCTVGLGLQKSVAKRSEDGKLKLKLDILLKAKVALNSILLETPVDT